MRCPRRWHETTKRVIQGSDRTRGVLRRNIPWYGWGSLAATWLPSRRTCVLSGELGHADRGSRPGGPKCVCFTEAFDLEVDRKSCHLLPKG